MPKSKKAEEPSVLDYLKASLKFWDRSAASLLPPEPAPRKRKAAPVKPVRGKAPAPAKPSWWSRTTAPAKPARTPARPPAAKKAVPARRVALARAASVESLPPRPWPWRSLLALALALAGQRFFEPASRSVHVAYILYVLALAFLVWAIVVKEWTLAPLPEAQPTNENLRVRRLPFFVSIVLTAGTFAFSGGNLFTSLNVTLWILSVIFFIWAFWIPAPEASLAETWRRVKEFFTRPSWQLTFTRWTLLVLVVVGVVAFFRIYQINTVPYEPFSDHAEKLLDVNDVVHGQTHIFFPRNTGREAIQMYLTVVVAWLFHTGLTFLSLKIDMVICGLLTLPYLYLLGKELGGKRIGLLAIFFAGIAYWPNVISRVGLRFSLYPLFVAPTLYYLIRGLRTRNRNDFILSGLFLGLGLHGYSSFRIVPFVVVAAVAIYWVHRSAKGSRQNALLWLAILALMSLYVFMPLARYWEQNPEMFGMRAFSRLGSSETPLPGPWWQILASNIWNSLRMFNWDNGGIWVHSIPGRPAFDVVSAALLLLGAALLIARYVRERHWQDLFLLVSIPLLQLPSTLSLAFPAENPSLNRPGGAIIPAFLIVAIALDGLLTALQARKNPRLGISLVWCLALLLAGWSSFQNYDLVFNQYATDFRQQAWNTSEMADVIKQFAQVYGSVDQAWIVPYPYWVDTRLPGDWLNMPAKDFALWPQDFQSTTTLQGAKLFIVKPEDTQDVTLLQQVYPQITVTTYHSAVKDAGKDFLMLFVPPAQ